MRFRWFVRKSDFDTELENERIDIGDISFILDRLRIYTRSSSFDFSNRPIYQGETSTSDSVGTWTVTIDGIIELYDGLTVKVKITTGQGSSYSTLNVNDLGANPVWFGYGVPLTSSTPLALNQEVTLTYRTTASASGIEIGGTSYTRGWVLSEGLKTTVGQGLSVSNGALGLNYGNVNTGNTTQPVTGNAVYNAIPHTYIKSASVSDTTLTLTTQSDNTVNFTNTTYESKSASSGGTDVSLVTTGEKYIWNGKQDALTNPVTGSNLTADKIVLGNGTTTVKTSSKGITTTNPSSSSDDTTLPTSKAVWGAITAALGASDAMVFKGTLGTGGNVTAVPTTNVVKGDTYKVITAGTWAGSTCKVGDLLIALTTGASVAANTTNWAYVPSGDETVTTIATSSSPNVSSTAQSGAVTLGTAAAKGVTDNSSNADVASSDTNLITGRTLYYQLAKKGYTTNTGTVIKVSTGAGLTGGDITTTGTVKTNLVSETKLTNAASAATETAGRVYPVALDKDGKLAVNVPWSDNNTTYSAGTGVTITGDGNAINVTYGNSANTACQGNDSRLSDARTPTSHTHGNIQNSGALQTNDITIANGDKLVVTDSSDSSKVARTSIAFDGSTTTKALTPKGTWENFGTSNLEIGTTGATAAAGNHTHTASLATDTGTSAVTLAYGSKYKLTAGGDSVIFTMPTSNYSDIGYAVNTTTANGVYTGAITIDGTKPIHVIAITGDVTVTLSANPSEGHSTHVMFTSTTARTVTINHDSTDRVCPEAANVTFNLVANGYVEVDFLRANSKTYVRGV